jgi:DNA-binding NarL/FixJ family response regulator
MISNDLIMRAIYTAGFGLYLYDYSLGKSWANDFCFYFLGLPVPEDRDQIRNEWFERLHPEDEPVLMEALKVLFNGGNLYSCLTRYRHASGDYIPLFNTSTVVRRDEQGKPEVIIATVMPTPNQLLGQFSFVNKADVDTGGKKNNKHSKLPEPNRLTRKETIVLQLLACNMTTRDVARTLNLSPYTVETHRKNVLLKLRVNTTGAAIAHAKEHKWI